MKWVKRISIWIVVSLSLQCLGLFYIDHYFLADDSKVVTKKVEEEKPEQAKKIDIELPQNAEKVLVSYDAKFLSFYDEKELNIVNCKDGSVKSIEVDNGTAISFYKWLPDRNRMLIVEKKTNDESSDLTLYSYDVSKGEKVKVKDLTWSNSKSEIQDIQFSTSTGVIYVNVLNKNGKPGIYRIDRMGDMNKVDTIPTFVSKIASVRLEDKLVYEGLVYNSIFFTGDDKALSIAGVEKLTLIGTDHEDNVYVGELKNKRISKIYFGKISQKTEDWKVINLQDSSDKKDLFVCVDGKVYQNDTLKGVIKEVKSGTQTSYQGTLVQLYSKGLVSLVNNKVNFVAFK